MPVGEIFGATLRFIGHFIVDIIAEVLVKGMGYLICRQFSKSVEADGLLALVIGLLFWSIAISAIIYGYASFSEFLVVDSCLDNGGKFNYKAEACMGIE